MQPRAYRDINVTPLVDVCLVLLVIFMVVTEKLERGKHVPLPRTRYHAQVPDREQTIVSVTGDAGHARIFWNDEALAGASELKQIAAERLGHLDEPIYVKASSDLSYGDMLPVLVALKEAGSRGVQLGTQELAIR